jgi:hypothetical protein
MCAAKSRLFLALGALVAATPLLSAQAQRPAETRGVPIDLVCAPQAALAPPSQTMRIAGGVEPKKALFAAGERVLIDAGAGQGLQVGQHFFVRRVIEDRFTVRTTEVSPLSIHTAGWITIVDVGPAVATASVAEACDGVMDGDYLEPFERPAVVAASPAGTPDYDRPARVVLADDRRQLGAGGGSLMVIDRGSDHGLTPGQRLTLFRRTLDGAGPHVMLGEAFVASTRPDTSLMRIQTSREDIQVGDLIAIHR